MLQAQAWLKTWSNFTSTLSARSFSLASFLLSSLVVRVNLKALRSGILVSALGSISGCVFLTLALGDFVQIKLGTLACGSWYTAAAVGPLVIFVPSALVIYIYVVLHAFTR